ncbi:hypothetical protein [Streptomyces sp. NPDC020489]|uniref:hypothetical protein n=1 Tax=Streptomyces sp. NPDC020489 TaxID=3365077 RepID=UPI0037BBF6F4
MHLRTRTAATLTLAASLMGLVGLASPVSASAEASDTAQGRYCTVVVERVKPGEKASRVKSRTCSDDRTAATRSSAGTLLMSWYQHAGFGGDVTHVYGDYGPCDSDGYLLDTGLSRYMISSFRTYNNCDGQQAVLNDGRTTFYYYGYATSYVGDRANDDIAYFKVFDA